MASNLTSLWKWDFLELGNGFLYDHLVNTTLFFKLKRKKTTSHFIFLKIPLLWSPSYYNRDFMAQQWSPYWGSIAWDMKK